MADHLGLDLNLVELLAGVDADDASDHLGDDDHVTEVSLDEVGLLVGLGLLLGLAELLDQAHGLALQTTVDTSAGTGVDDITELVGGEVKEPAEEGVVLLAIHLFNPTKNLVKGSSSPVGVGVGVGVRSHPCIGSSREEGVVKG